MKIYSFIACLLVSGCATQYQSGKFSPFGGYSDSSVNEKLQKVVFSGNGYTDVDTAVKYARFHCAEIAEKNKKSYFLMYASLKHAAFEKSTLQPNSGSVGGKPAAFAYLLLSDSDVAGAIKTNDVISELKEFKTKSHEKSSGNQK